MLRRFLVSALLAAGMAGLFTACESSSDDVLVVTEDEAGIPVELAPGDRMDVVLKGNPTTGHEWRLGATNPKVLNYLGTSYESDSDLVGAGGTYYFRFSGNQAGSVMLTLNYVAPSGATVKSFRAPVVVVP